jgi:hypothetical protein
MIEERAMKSLTTSPDYFHQYEAIFQLLNPRLGAHSMFILEQYSTVQENS